MRGIIHAPERRIGLTLESNLSADSGLYSLIGKDTACAGCVLCRFYFAEPQTKLPLRSMIVITAFP